MFIYFWPQLLWWTKILGPKLNYLFINVLSLIFSTTARVIVEIQDHKPSLLKLVTITKVWHWLHRLEWVKFSIVGL